MPARHKILVAIQNKNDAWCNFTLKVIPLTTLITGTSLFVCFAYSFSMYMTADPRLTKLATFVANIVANIFFTCHGDQNGHSLECCKWVVLLWAVMRHFHVTTVSFTVIINILSGDNYFYSFTHSSRRLPIPQKASRLTVLILFFESFL